MLKRRPEGSLRKRRLVVFDQRSFAFSAKRSGARAVYRLTRAEPVQDGGLLPAIRRTAFGFCCHSRGCLSPSKIPRCVSEDYKPDACRRSFSCRSASLPGPCLRNNAEPRDLVPGSVSKLPWRWYSPLDVASLLNRQRASPRLVIPSLRCGGTLDG